MFSMSVHRNWKLIDKKKHLQTLNETLIKLIHIQTKLNQKLGIFFTAESTASLKFCAKYR